MTSLPPAHGDPIGRDAILSHRLTVPVLGIPVSFESTTAAVIDVVQEAYGIWDALDDVPALRTDDHVRIRIFVEPFDQAPADRSSVVYRLADADRVVLRARGCVGVTDVQRRDGVAWVDPSLVADRETFRYGVVEAMTQSVLTFLDRTPVHAAAIERDGIALLLAGPSGSGKSTLVYAAQRRGFRVLAEDLVFVQLRPRLHVWGLPGFVHLPLSARKWFPELSRALPRLLANGKEKIALDLRTMNALPDLPVVSGAGICSLARSPGAATLSRMTAAALTAELLDRLEPGFDRFAESIGEAIKRLARSGGWQLALSTDPGDAMQHIERMFASLAAEHAGSPA